MNVCGRLFNLCLVIREENDYREPIDIDPTLLRELKHLLDQLPEDDVSMVGAEGAAYYYESVGHIPAAIEAQRSLLAKIDRCRDDIAENDYNDDVLEILLERCDDEERNRCLSVLQRLESER